MEKWLIEYWNPGSGSSPIEKWLDKLTHEQFQAVTREIKLLEKMGNSLRLPHSKPLGTGLFELRERKYGYRIYYGFYGSYVIIVCAAGNKQSQERDIKIARKRLEAF